MTVIGSDGVAVTYGERFSQLRKKHWADREAGRTVLALSQRLGKGYGSSIHNIERSWRPPNLPTIAKHAKALGVHPWDLLEGVETEYDKLRVLAGKPQLEAEKGWRDLLERYEQSARRGASKSARRARAAPREARAARR